MKKHLIVVSVDAMVYEDFQTLQKMPAMGKLMQTGSIVKNVKTIYPSLTHPIHATLMSGCPAGVTGVVNNTIFEPGALETPWYNQMDQMRCETLFHAAKRAGLTTCACRWPLTAGAFDLIDYLVPEVMDAELAAEPDVEKLYKNAVTPMLFEDIVKPNLYRLSGNKHPNDEHFSIACACEIIRKYRPNLLMTHPCMVDSTRHRTGLFNDAVTDALRLTDEWIGQLIRAVEDAGIADATSFCIVSDHGHLEIKRSMAINVFLKDRGLIQADAEGNFVDWKAFAQSAGLSAQVYVKHEADRPAVYAALKEMCEEGIYGMSEVLTVEETDARYGLKGDFAFVIETDGFTSFRDDWMRPAVRPLDISDYRYGHSTHGHMPEKGPQPPMLLSGPAFQRGVVVEHASVLDEAPTFAAALGLTLPNACGNPIANVLAQ